MENYVDVQSYGNTPYVEFLTEIFKRVYEGFLFIPGITNPQKHVA